MKLAYMSSVEEVKQYLENLSKFEYSEEEYIKDMIAMESEEDSYIDLKKTLNFEISCIEREMLDMYGEMMSTESLKDRLTYQKSRLVMFLKSLLKELIKMILDFFSFGMSQKKIMLMLSKDIEKSIGYLIDRYSERIETKGIYDFEEKPISIRNTVNTILNPVVLLSIMSIVLKTDVSKLVETNMKGNVVDQELLNSNDRIALILKQNPNLSKEIEDLFGSIKTLVESVTKINLILSIMTLKKTFLVITDERKLGDNSLVFYTRELSEQTKENKIVTKEQVSNMNIGEKIIVSITGLNLALSGELSLEELNEVFYIPLCKILGVELPADDPSTFSKLNEYLRIFFEQTKQSKYIEAFEESNINNLKKVADVANDNLNENLDTLTEYGEVDINSDESFMYHCIGAPKIAAGISRGFRNINIGKTFDEMKRAMDKASKKLTSSSSEALEILESIFNITKFIAVSTYLYQSTRSISNAYLRTSLKSIDNGLTDLKKVESYLV